MGGVGEDSGVFPGTVVLVCCWVTCGGCGGLFGRVVLRCGGVVAVVAAAAGDVHIVQVRHSCYVTSMQRKKSYSTLQSVH